MSGVFRTGGIVMSRKEELTSSSSHLYREQARQKLPIELLREGLNLNPYKNNQAWPGRNYILVGNSFNLDRNFVATTSDTKRSATIAMVLVKGSSNRKCVSIEDAFNVPGFTECLSRFEFDWLKKQPPSTLIGPAYNELGALVPLSFAVWRRHQLN